MLKTISFSHLTVNKHKHHDTAERKRELLADGLRLEESNYAATASTKTTTVLLPSEVDVGSITTRRKDGVKMLYMRAKRMIARTFWGSGY